MGFIRCSVKLHYDFFSGQGGSGTKITVILCEIMPGQKHWSLTNVAATFDISGRTVWNWFPRYILTGIVNQKTGGCHASVKNGWCYGVCWVRRNPTRDVIIYYKKKFLSVIKYECTTSFSGGGWCTALHWCIINAVQAVSTPYKPLGTAYGEKIMAF